MFVGRDSELTSLNEAYHKAGFQFPVIYGRRRIGKTALINAFCQGKKSVYFMAVQSTMKENLEILSHQILAALAPDAPRNPFSSFREALAYVFRAAETERVVFAIDEYPYLAESDWAVSSILQAAVDRYHEKSQLFLLLCGSSMSFMEEQVLDYKSPLYGRRTAQYKLLPFDYLTSAALLPAFSPEEKIVLYSITGGIPEYLSRIDNDFSLYENVRGLLFDPAGRLFEEPPNLLKQELRSPQTYNAIIAAIAGGASRLNEIATKANIETSQASKMLGTLMALGLVKKEVPVTDKADSKKTIYLLDDQMFVFWYRFVWPDTSRIAAGLGATVCQEVFDGPLADYVGRAFEKCAMQYMWRQLQVGALPFSFQKIGRWWGSNRLEKREEEIDFIALAKDSAIFGECKWRNQLLDEGALNALIRKAELLPTFNNRRYYLFSKSGFTTEVKARAKKEGNIVLVSLEEMFL
ncbi:MAG: ATP-binding protein [Lachnospiraceae bacterium]|jgi:AAA+ ATPase superfamily predicted ATPase|nr:ATP-binding protein [Lachnospiraceae bacterium]